MAWSRRPELNLGDVIGTACLFRLVDFSFDHLGGVSIDTRAMRTEIQIEWSGNDLRWRCPLDVWRTEVEENCLEEAS